MSKLKNAVDVLISPVRKIKAIFYNDAAEKVSRQFGYANATDAEEFLTYESRITRLCYGSCVKEEYASTLLKIGVLSCILAVGTFSSLARSNFPKKTDTKADIPALQVQKIRE